jgi:hypothetical protein
LSFEDSRCDGSCNATGVEMRGRGVVYHCG